MSYENYYDMCDLLSYENYYDMCDLLSYENYYDMCDLLSYILVSIFIQDNEHLMFQLYQHDLLDQSTELPLMVPYRGK